MESDALRAAYEQGRENGRVDQVLVQHEEHLAQINGSIKRTAEALKYLGQQVIRLDERAEQRELGARAERDAHETRLARRDRVFALLLSLAMLVVVGLTQIHL